ncbi:MAG: hypothetical protein A2Y34_15165 [Spirochaetes bacterium GWC1_27_15]|nr:MAG: hypothetical protein A2Z98_09700 [Spirochaetes bacterium GWB1_27_13]OHD19979.1 MAG: hypothetical protein A2Y34_15165 [Spirochaetes bacterium GWC1_27_15]
MKYFKIILISFFLMTFCDYLSPIDKTSRNFIVIWKDLHAFKYYGDLYLDNKIKYKIEKNSCIFPSQYKSTIIKPNDNGTDDIYFIDNNLKDLKLKTQYITYDVTKALMIIYDCDYDTIQIKNKITQYLSGVEYNEEEELKSNNFIYLKYLIKENKYDNKIIKNKAILKPITFSNDYYEVNNYPFENIAFIIPQYNVIYLKNSDRLFDIPQNIFDNIIISQNQNELIVIGDSNIKEKIEIEINKLKTNPYYNKNFYEYIPNQNIKDKIRDIKSDLLDLSNLDLINIPFIKYFSNLSSLKLYRNKFTEIKDLDNLPNLTNLDLYKNQLTEIKGLDKLPNLTNLSLSGNKLTEINGLDKLPNLISLSLTGNKLTEINGLDKLSNLTDLYLSYNQLSEIKGLDKLSNLTYLYLDNNQLKEIKGLEKLPNLTKLGLDNNKLIKIEGLDKLPNLTYLNLSYNNLTKIEGLDKISNLNTLSLSWNKLKKINGLDNLTNLNELYLSDNHLKGIKGLEKLPNLTYLYLFNNYDLSDINQLKNLTKLTYLDIENTNIKSISFSNWKFSQNLTVKSPKGEEKIIPASEKDKWYINENGYLKKKDL